MGNKKSIAFYTCTNGLGHFKRVTEVAKLLKDDHNITIYCTKFQPHIIGKLENVDYKYYTLDNIRWDLVLKGDSDEAIDQYLNWSDKYMETLDQYDIIISDNLVSLCKARKDTLLMGSFFWADVFEQYLGKNFLTDLDRALLKTRQPAVFTNRYLETQSMKEYNNKIQFGFGCSIKKNTADKVENIIGLQPSLDYNSAYKSRIEQIITASKFGVKENLSYINNVCIVARPGVGTITHCVEHSIPLIALYSKTDSAEIVELAQYVEELNIGFKQEITQPLRLDEIRGLSNNTYFSSSNKLEAEGYRHIAKHIKQI